MAWNGTTFLLYFLLHVIDPNGYYQKIYITCFDVWSSIIVLVAVAQKITLIETVLACQKYHIDV